LVETEKFGVKGKQTEREVVGKGKKTSVKEEENAGKH